MVMCNDLLLSIIIPVYNVELYLGQCLDSILSQSFRNYEIICIDDCSEDKSFSILKDYEKKDSRITVLQNEKNLGVGLTRNIGLLKAKGEYIHFIDPDDWLEEDVYEILLSKLAQYSKLDMLYFNYKLFDNETGTAENFVFKNQDILDKVLHPIKNPEVFDNWDRYCWIKLFRRNFLIENNIFFKDYISLSDVEHSALTYTKAESIVYTDIKVINYRTKRKNSLVSQSEKNIQGTFESFLNNRKLYEKLPTELKYRMLGADYFLLTTGIPNAYKLHFINIFQLIYMVNMINSDREYKKYVFEPPYWFVKNRPLQLSIWKILIQTHLPRVFDLLIMLRNFLFRKIG